MDGVGKRRAAAIGLEELRDYRWAGLIVINETWSSLLSSSLAPPGK